MDYPFLVGVMIQRDALRRAEGMRLFTRNGMVHYGKFSQWWRASPDEAKHLLEKFRSEAANDMPT